MPKTKKLPGTITQEDLKEAQKKAEENSKREQEEYNEMMGIMDKFTVRLRQAREEAEAQGYFVKMFVAAVPPYGELGIKTVPIKMTDEQKTEYLRKKETQKIVGAMKNPNKNL